MGGSSGSLHPWLSYAGEVARVCASPEGTNESSPGQRPRCSTQVESARAKMLENGIAVADREQRGSFPSLVSPVRRLLGGFVYKNEGNALGRSYRRP